MARAGTPPGGYPLKTQDQTGVLSSGQRSAGSFNASAPVYRMAADGAVPIQNGTVVFTKGSAIAATLAAPTAAQEGTIMRFVTGSAFAHVLTATALIDNGVTGGSKSAWTAAAFLGSSLTLLAYNLKWTVLNFNLGAIA